MKHPEYYYDFTHLEEVLCSQFEPTLLADALEESLYAIICDGVNTGEKAGTIIRRFDAVMTLLTVFKKISFQQSVVYGD